MKLISNEEYQKIFPQKIESDNIKYFSNLLDQFFLDKKTKMSIFRNFEKELRSREENYLDELFCMNESRRAVYKYKKTSNEDPAFSEYKRMIKWNLRIRSRRDIDRIQEDNNIPYFKIINYKNFVKNSFIFKKQKVRLTKYLLNNNILYREDIDVINSLKNASNGYFCISRNPIDYLFCSTNQSYSSCQKIENGAVGLGGLSLDPNRVLVFTTTGVLFKYYIRNMMFNHFRYVCRSWGLLNNKDEVCIIREYPSKSVNFRQLLKQVGINSVSKSLYNISKFEFEPPRYSNRTNSVSFIYLDNIGFGLNRKKKKLFYKQGGLTGYATHAYIEKCFDDLESIHDISIDANDCSKCKMPILEHPSSFDGECGELSKLCLECFNELSPRYLCDRCKRYIINSEPIKCNINYFDKILCRTCSDNDIVPCVCGNTNIFNHEFVCSKCMRQLVWKNAKLKAFGTWYIENINKKKKVSKKRDTEEYTANKSGFDLWGGDIQTVEVAPYFAEVTSPTQRRRQLHIEEDVVEEEASVRREVGLQQAIDRITREHMIGWEVDS